MSKKTNKLLNKKPDILMLPSELIFPIGSIIMISLLMSGMGVSPSLCAIFCGSFSIAYYCLTYGGAWRFFTRFFKEPNYTRAFLFFRNILDDLAIFDRETFERKENGKKRQKSQRNSRTSPAQKIQS